MYAFIIGFVLNFVSTGHLCSSSLSQHWKDSLHFWSGCLHPQLQKRCVQQHQVCGVPDAAGCQCVLQLHNALPPALLEHVHWSRYIYISADTLQAQEGTCDHCSHQEGWYEKIILMVFYRSIPQITLHEGCNYWLCCQLINESVGSYSRLIVWHIKWQKVMKDVTVSHSKRWWCPQMYCSAHNP